MAAQLNRRTFLWRTLFLGTASVAMPSLLTSCSSGSATATPTRSIAAASPTAVAARTTSSSTTTTPTQVAKTPTPAPSPGASSASVRIMGPYPGEAQALTGAGSTFAAPLYTKWAADYEKLTGVKVNYQSIGSGGGIKSLQDMTVDFGATDAPMSDEQIQQAKGGPILHIPTALGGVVITYNIPELAGKDALKFTPETLSGIFLGTIINWNDPKLVADNPSLANLDKPIVVVHRSDGSGTTFILVSYLAAVSEDWKSKVGVGTSVNWPVGIGAKGNEGVAGTVKQNPYSIGYVELIYALQNQIPYGLVRNKAGNFVTASLDTVKAAAAGASKTMPQDLRAMIVNADGANAYPISGFTWILAYQNMQDEAKAIALTRFLWWGLTDGQQYHKDLGYAPLASEVVALALEKVKQITVNGKPAFPGK